MEIRHPEIKVPLTNTPGSSDPRVVIGAVSRALRAAGRLQYEIDDFFNEAIASGSPDGVLQVAMQWVDIS